ncbi:MAG: histidine kinase [Bacteroidales bacterium]|nr:histidine kinase [Bacteroidales bacterium]
MKTQGLKDLYLPQLIARHVKFLLFCAAFTPIWGMIINAELNKDFLFSTFVVMLITIELVYLVSEKILKINIRSGKKEITRTDITRMYLIRLVLFYIVSIALTNLIVILYLYLFHLIGGYDIPSLSWFLLTSQNILKVTAIGFLFATPIFFFVPWQQSLKREFELREQNLIFQNETLKSQVNPHFLFNSLNTLASLVNTDAEKASQFISKLSLMYRYILDNSQKVKVPLKDELAFIEDYFYLHEARSKGKILLSINIKESNYEYEILPVSLQVLIENAIKHNMATIEKPLRIVVYMEEQQIVVKNNLQKMATQVVSTKIGLNNLNERVRLITGKEITIEETTNDYLVKIPLLS